MEFRGFLGALIAFVLLIALQSYLVKSARRRAAETTKKRVAKFMDLIITSEDERYSLSRLQMYLWTFFVIIGFLAVFLSILKIPEIPQNLCLLMGVNLAASVTSTAITTWRREKKHKGQPDFVKDIFFENEDSLDLPRTQMFAWTIVSLLVFVIMLIKTCIDGKPSLPDIPIGLVAVMGLSHGAYLGVKKQQQEKEEATKPKR
jgi:hypothetical protein